MQAQSTEQPISINNKVFQELFDFHFNALCAFCRKYVESDTAEDIVQEVFISFWHKKEDFTHLNAAKAFLYKSVRNKSLNHIRDEAVRQKHLNASAESDFEQFVIEEETFNQLYNEIKNLPPASQQVMLLALNGLKNPEIADELNISLNTVKTQKKIAYAKLKSRISPFLHAFVLTL